MTPPDLDRFWTLTHRLQRYGALSAAEGREMLDIGHAWMHLYRTLDETNGMEMIGRWLKRLEVSRRERRHRQTPATCAEKSRAILDQIMC